MRKTQDARRPNPIAVADRIGEHPPHQRDTAISYLRDKLAAREAGLDPFDAALFIVQAGAHEIVWAYRMLEQVGAVISIREDGDGRRYKAVLQTAARTELRLDDGDCTDESFMTDEPLASRGVDSTIEALFDAAPDAPDLRLVEEPLSTAAIRRAKQAYDERVEREGQVH